VFLLFQQILSLLKVEAKKIEKPICAGSTTDPIIIHCTTASAQRKNLKFGLFEIFSFKSLKNYFFKTHFDIPEANSAVLFFQATFWTPQHVISSYQSG